MPCNMLRRVYVCYTYLHVIHLILNLNFSQSYIISKYIYIHTETLINKHQMNIIFLVLFWVDDIKSYVFSES